MNETTGTILFYVLLVVFGLPLVITLAVETIFGIIQRFTGAVGDAGRALIVPALIVALFKYLHDRNKETPPDDRVHR